MKSRRRKHCALAIERLEPRDLLAAAEPLWRYPFDVASAPAEFTVPGGTWPQPGGLGSPVTLTYSLSNLTDGGLPGGLAAPQLRAAVEEALGLWAAYAPLYFVEVADSGPVPDDIEYAPQDHPQLRIGHHAIDGEAFPDELAHAYLPPDAAFADGLAGDVHFDDGNAWSLDPDTAVDVLEVLVHELGHALGLGHEEIATAIMNPFYAGRYDGLGTAFLFEDDIAGIRSLYGSGVGAVTPVVDIGIFGAGVEIASGDTIPSTADGTYFATAILGTAGIEHYFTITNRGQGTLELTGTPAVQLVGPDAGDFTVVAVPATSLAAQGSTTFSLRFVPTSVGLRTAAVLIASNDADESIYEFAIAGRGLSPQQEIEILGRGQPIVAGDATPSAVDGTEFGFVNVNGGTATRTFTIENAGALRLSLLGDPSVALVGPHAADFAIAAMPAAEIPRETASSFSIRFDPTAIGLRTAVVRVASDDADEDPYEFTVAGTGYAANAEIGIFGNGISIADGDATPGVLDHTAFGAANVAGALLVRTYTITNTGVGPLHLTHDPPVALAGSHAGDFRVINQPATPVFSGGATTFSIAFDPSAAGTRSATVVVENSDANENPFEFAISGNGFAAAAEIEVRGEGRVILSGDDSPQGLDGTDFGNAAVGAPPASRTFVVANVGSGALNLIGSPRVAITGENAADFRVSSFPAGAVNVGGTVSFTIEFSPSGGGRRAATVNVPSNDDDENPYEFAIVGFGAAPPHVVGVTVGSTVGEHAFHELEAGTGRLQWRPLPWVNLDRIEVRFDQDVVLAAGDLMLVDGAGATLNFAPDGFDYDGASHTAAWRFEDEFVSSRFTLLLKSYDGVRGVRNGVGTALDGEWTEPTAYDEQTSDVFPSGDGIPGGDCRLSFRVNPGNVEQAIVDNADESLDINWLDLRAVLDRQFRAAGDAAYSKWADLDGNGAINAVDAVFANNYRDAKVSIAAADAAIASVSNRESSLLVAFRQRLSRRPSVPQPLPETDMVTPRSYTLARQRPKRQRAATQDRAAALLPAMPEFRRLRKARMPERPNARVSVTGERPVGKPTSAASNWTRSAMDHHPMHLHDHTFWVIGTEGGRIPEQAWIPTNT